MAVVRRLPNSATIDDASLARLAGEKDPRVREGLQLSINAIATALRNSG